MHYNLMSYYYIPKNPKRALGIIEQSERIMIDSGAHTFQKGKTKLNWEEYTESYARFIRENDCSIISDPKERKQMYWGYVTAGKFPFWRYLVEFEGYSEDDAKAIAAEADAENRSHEALTFGGA